MTLTTNWQLILAVLPFLLAVKALTYFAFLMRIDPAFDTYWLQRLGANLRGVSLVITIVGLGRIASGFGQGQAKMADLLAESLGPTAVGFGLALVADFMADLAEKRRALLFGPPAAASTGGPPDPNCFKPERPETPGSNLSNQPVALIEEKSDDPVPN